MLAGDRVGCGPCNVEAAAVCHKDRWGRGQGGDRAGKLLVQAVTTYGPLVTCPSDPQPRYRPLRGNNARGGSDLEERWRAAIEHVGHINRTSTPRSGAAFDHVAVAAADGWQHVSSCVCRGRG